MPITDSAGGVGVNYDSASGILRAVLGSVAERQHGLVEAEPGC